MAIFSIDILGLTSGTPKTSDNYMAVDILDPTMSTIGTNKKYSIANLFGLFLTQFGFTVNRSVVAATTGLLNATYDNGIGGINATLTDASGTFAPFTLDGITGVVGDAYLVKNQIIPSQNGIYILDINGDGVSIPWKLIRASYFNSNANIIDNSLVLVQEGLVNANTTWQVAVIVPVVVGITAINFNPFSMNVPPILQPWNIATTGITMDPNNGYIANNNVTRVQLLLPPVCPVGTILEVTGIGLAGWQIIQNVGQDINFGILTTTTGIAGNIASTIYDDSLRMVCVVANTRFNVLSAIGNPTVV